MLRLVGFFLVVLLAMQVLRALPIVGALFAIPILGFWFTAILLSVLIARWTAHALDRSKVKALVRQLGAVETPHNQGKLGSLLAGQGRHAKALAHLESAAQGEPESVEWAYRLGISQLETGRTQEAIASLERGANRNEEHAYGRILLRLAEAYTAAGRGEDALVAVERFERNHGESAESAYRRGLALRRAGRRGEARAAFTQVGELARSAAAYQKKRAGSWAFRAFLARLV